MIHSSHENQPLKALSRLSAESVPQGPPLLENDCMCVKRCKYGLMLYNRNDVLIGKSLDLYGEWADAELKIIEQLLQPGDTVVDMGANIGTHTIAFARKVGPQGFVFAFEPQRIVYHQLCANVALNHFINVRCFQMGLGREKSAAKVPPLDLSKEQNFGSMNMMTHNHGDEVAIIPLDDLGLSRCRLIKMDVEGMEVEALEGARETIKRLRPALFIENNALEYSAKIIETVFGIGYRAFWQIAGYFNPRNFFNNPHNVFADLHPEANILCVPKDVTIAGSLLPVTDINDNWQKAFERMRQKTA